MITFLIMVVISLEELFEYFWGEEFSISWYIPMTVVFVSILSSLATLILYNDGEEAPRKFIVKVVIHFILTFCIVLGSGYIFKWYSNFEYFIFTVIAFVLIYIGVWVATISMLKHDEKLISEALENVRDDE